MDKVSWQALEYEEKEKSNDWFWALGVIIITSSIASIIYQNYFFATLIILGGVLLGFFAKRTPIMVIYELNDKGLQIRSRLYPYKNIKSFYIHTNQNDGFAYGPTLFIKTERIFMPIISIPVEYEITEKIYSILSSQEIKEEEMHEHPSVQIMDYLGF